MRWTLALLSLALLATSCTRERQAPFEETAVSSSIKKQLTEKLGDRLSGIGRVSYDSEKNAYFAEIFYKENDDEKTFVMQLHRYVGPENPNQAAYSGQFPWRLAGKTDPHGEGYWQVLIVGLENDQRRT